MFICKRRLITAFIKLLEIGSLAHCGWKYKMVPSVWKTLWRFLKILKIELPYDPASPPLGMNARDLKSGS